MKLEVQFLDIDAVFPIRAHDTDAGLDLVATRMYFDAATKIFTYSTGIAVAIPKGYAGLLFPRSSITKTDLILANSVGVIDSDYRGELLVKFRVGKEQDGYSSTFPKAYQVGEKIAQLVIIPIALPTPIQVVELNTTERGKGGFGSTGA